VTTDGINVPNDSRPLTFRYEWARERSPMRNIQKIIVIAVTLAPLAAFAQTVGTGVGANPVPGGITLVPGTVVTPGVGGSAVTGTVPLPGTIGSPGVGNLNPGLSARPNPGVPGNSGALYAPTYYPQTAIPGAEQNTLPRSIIPNSSPFSSSMANCPAGATPGMC
jgi:hypothetical protein